MRVFFMRHIQGESRQQSTLFPERLDDYVSADNPVRIIDAYVDQLDMAALGFTYAQTKTTGRKPYHPGDLLKLYLYGYLNQLRSTRRLEKECHRNLEVVWLLKRLAPDFKTLANFRQQNSHAIRQACRAFIRFCREADLLDGRIVAIDGSKFKAAASMDKTYKSEQLSKLQRHLEYRIDDYLKQLKASEQDDTQNRGDIQKALKQLQNRQRALNAGAQTMADTGAKHCCETEPEARRMRSGRDGIVVGYNVQTAVETNTGLIVHYDITDQGSDNRQLEPMAKAVKTELKAKALEILADAGYSNGEQLAACEESDITPNVPTNRSSNPKKDHYQKSDFRYDAEKNQYACPAGQILTQKTKNTAKKLYQYTRVGCDTCPQQSRCTSAKQRWISRHFYEDALERSQKRIDDDPGLMKTRAATVERPFGHIKQMMGLRRFSCWGKNGADAEMGLSVLAYNLTRLMNHIGAERLLGLLQVRA